MLYKGQQDTTNTKSIYYRNHTQILIWTLLGVCTSCYQLSKDEIETFAKVREGGPDHRVTPLLLPSAKGSKSAVKHPTRRTLLKGEQQHNIGMCTGEADDAGLELSGCSVPIIGKQATDVPELSNRRFVHSVTASSLLEISQIGAPLVGNMGMRG